MKFRHQWICVLLVSTLPLLIQNSLQEPQGKPSVAAAQSPTLPKSNPSDWESSKRVDFVMAEIKRDPKQDKTYLEVVLKLKDGFRTSALMQGPEGSIGFPTEISLEPSQQFELSGQFEPTDPPLRATITEDAGGTWLYHEKRTTWQAEIAVADEIDIKDLVIIGKIRFAVQAPDS